MTKQDMREIQKLKKLRKLIIDNSHEFTKLAGQIHHEWKSFSVTYKDSDGIKKIEALSSEAKKLASSMQDFLHVLREIGD